MRPGDGNELYAVPSKRARDRDRHARRRRSTHRKGGKHSRSGKRKPAHLVLHGDADRHRKNLGAKRQGWRTDPPRSWKGGSGTFRKTVENTMALEWNAWVKACRHLSTFARLGHPHKSRIIFSTVQMEEAGRRGGPAGPPYAPLGEILTAQDGSHKRRTKIQDLIRCLFSSVEFLCCVTFL